MDENAIYDNSGTNQNQPTTTESGRGEEQGANKRDPISASPSIGRTIAGRDVHGESTVTDSGTHDQPDTVGTESQPNDQR